MKVVIPSEKFPELDAIIGEMPYKYAKPILDFINSNIVNEGKVEPITDAKVESN